MSDGERENRLPFDATATAGDADTPGDAGVRPRLDRGEPIGRYMVVDKLGEGGMGVVYAAYDPDLDRKVAVKLLRASGASREARGRLLREAQAMARLHHPNVVTVYEVGTDERGDFVAMLFVEGETLADWLAGAARDPRAILEVFLQAGRGLAAAHAAGLIHRDFKPANVLVDREGRARVTDFGLATRVGEPSPGADPSLSPSQPLGRLTHTGAVMGTPAYMAPEQYLGRDTDDRTDQFSFCVALYEALYGERPFAGETYDSLRDAVLAGEVRSEPSGADVPSRVRRALLRGLAVAPVNRYPSMDELLADLAVDPGIARRRWMTIAAVGTVAAAAAFAIARTSAEAPSMCDRARDNLAGVWDAAARSRLETAFAATGSPAAAAAHRGFVESMDRYADRWVEMHGETCRATHIEHTQPEDVMLLRMSCLQEKRGELASLARVFTHVDAKGVEQAVQAAHGLSDLTECADVGALQTGIRPPKDEATAAAVDEIRAQLADARALREAGQHGRALELAERAREAAAGAGYPPVHAESLVLAGTLNVDLGHTRTAIDELEDAAIVAEEAGYPQARAQARVEIARLYAKLSDLDRAREEARRAAAAVQSYGRDPKLQARLDEYRARILESERRPGEALGLLEEAAAVYEREDDVVKLAAVWGQRADIYQQMGELEKAEQELGRALDARQRALGADHPSVPSTLQSLADVVRLRGDYDRARELAAQSATFWQTERGQELIEAAAREQELPNRIRTVSGRVVRPDGTPAAGAEVVIGTAILSDGKYLWADHGIDARLAFAMERTRTDADGRFRFGDMADDALGVAAEITGELRSQHVRIEPGVEPVEVTVALREVGGVRGRVSSPELLGPAGFVNAVPAPFEASMAQMAAMVGIADDGTFSISNLAPGDYDLLAAGTSMDTAGADFAVKAKRRVTVRAKQTTRADIELLDGTVSLEVIVRGEGGRELATAQLLLFPGTLKGTMKAKAFNERIGALIPNGGLQSAFVPGGIEHVFSRVSIGPHSLCVVPLGGDIRDPEYARTLTGDAKNELPVHCRVVDVTQSPARQSLVVEVAPPPAVRP